VAQVEFLTAGHLQLQHVLLVAVPQAVATEAAQLHTVQCLQVVVAEVVQMLLVVLDRQVAQVAAVVVLLLAVMVQLAI
jgi:uncharacterized membrane protein YphA (DoxX/SURF4 family)